MVAVQKIKIEELELAAVVPMEKAINENNTVLNNTTTRQGNPKENAMVKSASNVLNC